MNRLCFVILFLVVGISAGCSGGNVGNPRALAGGTAGVLTLGGTPKADLQVNVFADAMAPQQRLGYGVTNSDGAFTLIASDGQGPLKLTAGKYRFTLESVAADPIPIPPSVSDALKTSLVREWTGHETKLELSVP